MLTAEAAGIDGWKDLDKAEDTLAAGRGYWTTDVVKAESPKARVLPLDAPYDQLRAVAQAAGGAVPLGREGRYDDVARAVNFQADPAESGHVTGTVLTIGGGAALA